MKLFIIGCGSIGTRHAKNIAARQHELVLYDVDTARAKQLAAELAATRVASIEDGIALKPDAAFICTPPKLHVPQALQCVRANIPVFIEKPLAHALDDVEALAREAEQRNVPTMVACNMRFDIGLQNIKELLPKLGKLISAHVELGYDLRKWRPSQDYRKNYAASRAQGGGIVLDAIHELDYARWLFGEPRKMFSKVMHSGLLDIETEDNAEFVLEMERCPVVFIHLDYLNPKYTRGCKIVGEHGSITWDFDSGILTVFIDGTCQQINREKDKHSMYETELDHFLSSLQNGTAPMNPVREAAATLDCALALRAAGEQQ